MNRKIAPKSARARKQAKSEQTVAITEQMDDFLVRAVETYRQFSDTAPPSDAKEFAAYQAACKAALAHLEALLKLVRLVTTSTNAESGDGDPAPFNQATKLIAEARAGLAQRRPDREPT